MFGKLKTKGCACGKEHVFTSKVIIERNAIEKLPSIFVEMNLHSAFIFADKNTYSAAGENVIGTLERSGIKIGKYIFSAENLEPDESNVGLAIMNFDPKFDAIIGVGSGVINDISKIVANVSEKKYIIVGTAPSMDGYASTTSSMTLEGLKISLHSRCADVIIGDLDVLCNAPTKMMISGLGDMLAKYVSICEWRIANLINGEYYCEDIAKLVRDSLKKCIDNASGLLMREENAVKAVFEGLVICGAAMKFAGLSRPASGVEHYISHILDMRGVEFNTPVEMHGLQCAIGTLISLKLYEELKKINPSRVRALKYVENFDLEKWNRTLRTLLGKSAETLISLEKKEGKYDKQMHSARLDIILERWNEILNIMVEELPRSEDIEALMLRLGMPTTLTEIGTDEKLLPDVFSASKDIRDKYVLSRLAWDLGVINNLFKHDEKTKEI